jgi:exopolysaccharide biosynthesis WecB/TagA/CpsF family protein
MRISVWGIKIDIITINELLEFIEENINNSRIPMQITGVNPEIIVKSLNNQNLKDAINGSSVVNIDGISVSLGLKILGYSNAKRVTCPDIFEALIYRANKRGYKIFFLGAKDHIVKEMIIRLQQEYLDLRIVGYHNGYFDIEKEVEIAESIRLSNADILFIGISSPKKELFIKNYLDFMNVPLCLGVGGIFDIKAGLYKRAPILMQKMGLEWLYRLLLEPKRLIRRQINIYLFLNLVLKTLIKKKICT